MLHQKISYNIVGASHADFIGIEIEGFEKDKAVDLEKLKQFMNRRKASISSFSTSRIELDEVVFESGIENEKTTGEKIVAKIFNTAKRSNDYNNLKYCPRPSHADYSAYSKYGLDYDMTGGGKFSGRMTATMCIAGGIAKQILEEKGIKIGAYISSIGNIQGKSYKDFMFEENDVFAINENSFPLLSNDKKEDMLSLIENAKSNLDSVGGIIECVCFNLKAGLGDTFDNGLESKISSNVFAIPAVKGVEFGSGFDISKMSGSEANDQFYYENGVVKTKTNNNGGINGGIANGMPLTLSVAIKPTPSIAKMQNTVNLMTKENVQIEIKGRHDACIVPRAVPVVEAMVALAIYDEMLIEG